jgi:hypothetical protein
LLHSETHGSRSSFQAKKLVGKRNPHLSDCTAARPTDLIQSSSGSIHKLRLVLLLSGSGGIFVLSHELINVKIIIGLLESLASSGFHI